MQVVGPRTYRIDWLKGKLHKLILNKEAFLGYYERVHGKNETACLLFAPRYKPNGVSVAGFSGQ